MLTSIVIPTHDAGDMLLRAIETVDPAHADIELIVVDNGSTDGSVQRALARFPDAKVIRYAHNTGFAPACDAGADAARGDFILFLNTDAFLRPADFDRLIDAARIDRDGAIWQPVNIAPDGDVDSAGDLFNITGIFPHVREAPSSELVSIFATKGAAMLVRTDVFRELGGFHADYFAYFEESDLCWRARLLAYEVRLVTDASVDHVGGATTARILSPEDIRYLSFRNRIRTVLSNAAAPTLVRMVPAHLAACLGFAFLYVVTGRPRSAASVAKALWWAVTNGDVWRAQRAKVQAARRADD